MNSQDSLIALSIRIGELERQNSRFRRAGKSLLLAILCCFLLAARREKIIRSNGFELQDSSGRVRAAIAFDEAGHPGLNLLDTSGQARIIVGFNEENRPTIDLKDPDENKRVGMGFDTDGSPGFDVRRKDGTGRFAVGLDEQELPIVNVLDERGQVRFCVGFEDHSPVLALGDGDFNQRIKLATSGASRAILADAAGVPQVDLRCTDSGSAVVQINQSDRSAVLSSDDLILVKGTEETWKATATRPQAAASADSLALAAEPQAGRRHRKPRDP